MEQVNRVSSTKSQIWILGNLGWRCIVEGLKRGILYGMIYATIYGAFCPGGAFLGTPWGLGVGAIVGTLLGFIDACVLVLFTALWSRRSAPKLDGEAQYWRGYRVGFTLIGVAVTMIGSLFLFPEVFFKIGLTSPKGLSARGADAGQWLDFVLGPTLVAGFAACQAAQKVVPFIKPQGDV